MLCVVVNKISQSQVNINAKQTKVNELLTFDNIFDHDRLNIILIMLVMEKIESHWHRYNNISRTDSHQYDI